MKSVKDYIRTIPDFPEEGIMFRDVTSVLQDAEGLQTMRTLARNMSFLMKSIALGKEAYGLPKKEAHQWTNFIR